MENNKSQDIHEEPDASAFDPGLRNTSDTGLVGRSRAEITLRHLATVLAHPSADLGGWIAGTGRARCRRVWIGRSGRGLGQDRVAGEVGRARAAFPFRAWHQRR